jgi:transcriptional regulator with XRE-family HTH domain
VRDYLKAMRKDRGLSLQDMADKIGISRQYYQLIENGERQKKMDITLVKRIATVLGVSLETIIEQENIILKKLILTNN